MRFTALREYSRSTRRNLFTFHPTRAESEGGKGQIFRRLLDKVSDKRSVLEQHHKNTELFSLLSGAKSLF